MLVTCRRTARQLTLPMILSLTEVNEMLYMQHTLFMVMAGTSDHTSVLRHTRPCKFCISGRCTETADQ